ncbi:MAG: endonuclease/exonuclease/phosphatase family protein [Bacteroidales bacterium]|nr:endonuclease/exonuclease/phosphatase family protein [Bacteroidales bacterium]
MLTFALCLILIASAFSDYINPTIWVLPSFLGIAFGVILVLAVVWFFVLLLFRRWHSLLVLLVTLAIVFVPASRYCPMHLNGGPEPLTTTEEGVAFAVDSLRVFSFNTNIMGQTHLSRIKEHIPVIDIVRKSGADIVCLQEYGFTLKPGGHTEQELRGELKDLYPYYDFMPNDQRKALGIAVFSKHPIRKAIRIDKRKKGYFSAMYYQLDVRGRTMGLVNMHLRSNMIDPKDRILYDEMIEKFEPDSLDRIRTGMMRALAQAYRLRSTESAMLRQVLLDQHPKDMPLLICGDMNDTPISYCYQSLRQVGLYDTWQETGVGPGITYRAHHFWFRIDHLLHSKHFRALHSRVRKDVKLSDHYPVEATFQILPQ